MSREGGGGEGGGRKRDGVVFEYMRGWGRGGDLVFEDVYFHDDAIASSRRVRKGLGAFHVRIPEKTQTVAASQATFFEA